MRGATIARMQNVVRSGGRALVDGLIANGVRNVFCVPGESYLGALDAMYAHRAQLRVIACRQEGGAAYMAEAHGKLTGEPGVCFVSRGPGASNAMIGVHTAFQDSTPMLLFIGQIPRAERGREAFQELDYARVYDGVAKRVMRVDSAEQIPQTLHDAWQSAIDRRPGPVVIELPEDTLTETCQVNDCAKPTRASCAPPPSSVATFSTLLDAAERPLIIFGGAAWTPRASILLRAFIEKHRLPAACAFRRQDMLDNTHPHYVGELGIAPNPELVRMVDDADLIVALSARLGEMTSGGYTLFDVPQFDARARRKLIHIFAERAELNAVYRAELGIACDAESFLQGVAGIPPRRQRDDDDARIARAHQSYLDFMNQPRDEHRALRMDKIMQWLRARLAADDIITCGAGNYTAWAQRNYQFRQPRTQLACTNGSMGYAVPAAIAAKLHRVDAKVVSFSGDGCFLMNGQELATAMQHRLAIVFIVLNNRCYGTIRAHQQRHYPRRPIATALRNPNFAELARAHGAFGAQVSRTEEFAPTFEQALDCGRAAVIEVKLDDPE